MADSQKERIMRSLGVSEAEAEEIIAFDKAIDRGERTEYDLDPEKEKEAKKMANVRNHRTTGVYNLNKRERKANPTKASIIAELCAFLTENSENACENVTITNKERQIAFRIGENDYELTLVQKRKPKNWVKIRQNMEFWRIFCAFWRIYRFNALKRRGVDDCSHREFCQ